MATGNETKIDTKLFAATADTLAACTKELERLCGDWGKTMTSLRSEWQGDASDNIKNTAEQARKSAAELLASLATYPVTLREIAGIYDNTEKNVSETGKTLRFDRAMR